MQQMRWARPALRTPEARKDFHDLVALCGLPEGGYAVAADDSGTVVTFAVDAAGAPAVERALARAYERAAGDRPATETVLHDQLDAASPGRPGGRAQFVPVGPGLFAGGPALAELLRRLDSHFVGLAASLGATEYAVPHLIAWESLRRAGFSAAFPQHLTACYSVRRDLDAVEELAKAELAADAAPLLEPQGACVAPAACYHLYPMLAGSTVEPGRLFTLKAQCSRRELVWTPQPIRFWSFQMRELVFVGTPAETARFRDGQLDLLVALAREIGLPCRVTSATDPFYTSGRAGQVGLQNLLGLKHELVARDAEGNDFAVSSVNLHRDHLGRAFDIRAGGRAAHSACLGVGLERWAYWILSHCGPLVGDWPAPLRRAAGDLQDVHA